MIPTANVTVRQGGSKRARIAWAAVLLLVSGGSMLAVVALDRTFIRPRSSGKARGLLEV